MSLILKHALLVAPLFVHSVAVAQAQTNACHPELTPKRRVVLSWGGHLDSPSYKEDLKAFYTQFRGQSDLHLAAWESGSIDKPADVVSIKPNPAGLEEALQKIKADFAANPVDPPEAYEVVFMVTNHGTRWLGSTPDYGFSGEESSALTQAQLRAFGRGLPKGIRFKAVTGTCYGQDSMDPLIEGLRENGSDCVCGTAQAAPGRTSTSPTAGRSWEQGNVRTSNTELSLYERRWSGAGYWVGLHQSSDENSDLSDNSYLITSEQEVMRFLKRKFPELKDLSPEEIEAKAPSLHKRYVAEAGGLTPGMKAQLKDSQRIQEKLLARFLEKPLGSPELAAEKKRVLSQSAFARVTWNRDVQDPAHVAWDTNWETYRSEVKALGDVLESARLKLNRDVAAHNTAIETYNSNYAGRMLLGAQRRQADIDAAEIDRLSAKTEASRSEHSTALSAYNTRVRRSPPRDLELNEGEIVGAKIVARQLLEEIFLKESSLDEKRHFWNSRSCEMLPMKTAALPQGEQGSDNSH
jgi:hypothetical protein